MARRPSRPSGQTSTPENPTPEAEPDAVADTGQDTPAADTAQGGATSAADAPEQTPEPVAMDTPLDETPPETTEGASSVEAQPEGEAESDGTDDHAKQDTAAEPAAAPERIVERRGPGVVPLVGGGIVAAAIGFGAAYLGYLPTLAQGDGAAVATLSERLEDQGETLDRLDSRTSELSGQIASLPAPAEAPEVDLSPLQSRIDEISATLDDLSSRLTELENRPVLSGDGGTEDAAAIAEAMARLQETIAAQEEANAALAEEIGALAEAAETRIAEAESRAEARVTTATAQAALSQLRIAAAAGNPFAAPLQDLAEIAGIEISDSLAAAAENGVPTLEELQATFPAAARAALPVALRETAGEGAMDRLGAFVRGQVGGRSLEPRAGDDPDAVLSRAEAAVASGDLEQALSELETLPEPARDELAIWISAARERVAATEALDDLARALDGTN